MLCIYVMTFIRGSQNDLEAPRWMQNDVSLTGGLWMHFFSNQQLVGRDAPGIRSKGKAKCQQRPKSQLNKPGPPSSARGSQLCEKYHT